MVTFLIGKNEEKFFVHKTFVCHYSPVLRAAFNSTFLESQTQTYGLDNISREAFQFFAEWLYMQKIDVVQLREEYDRAPENKAEQGKEEFALHELWVFGDKFSIPALQNLAMKAINDISNKWNMISTEYMQYVWANTQVDSPLRRYYMKRCVYSLGENFVKEEPSSFTLEILVDLTSYLMSLRTREVGAARFRLTLKLTEFLVSEES